VPSEVLLDLPCGLAEPTGGFEDPRAEPFGKEGEHGLMALALVCDPDEAPIGGGEQEFPDWCVDDPIRHIQDSFTRSARSEASMEPVEHAGTDGDEFWREDNVYRTEIGAAA
jgi:hypothetical protein